MKAIGYTRSFDGERQLVVRMKPAHSCEACKADPGWQRVVLVTHHNDDTDTVKICSGREFSFSPSYRLRMGDLVRDEATS